MLVVNMIGTHMILFIFVCVMSDDVINISTFGSMRLCVELYITTGRKIILCTCVVGGPPDSFV